MADVTGTIDFGTNWGDGVKTDQRLRCWNRMGAATNKGQRNPDMFHPMDGGLDANDNVWKGWLNDDLDLQMMGVMYANKTLNAGVGGFDELLTAGEWDDSWTNRWNDHYQYRQEDVIFKVLDGLVNHCGWVPYLQIFGPSVACWDGQGTPAYPLNVQYKDQYGNPYGNDIVKSFQNRLMLIFKSIQDNSWAMSTIATRAIQFMADIVNMCYGGYGTGINNWIFSFGCEVEPFAWDGWFEFWEADGDQTGVNYCSSDSNCQKAQAIFYKALADEVMGRSGCGSVKINVYEFLTQYALKQQVAWLYANRNNSPNYLEHIWGVSYHPYALFGDGETNYVKAYRMIDYYSADDESFMWGLYNALNPQLDAYWDAQKAASRNSHWDQPAEVLQPQSSIHAWQTAQNITFSAGIYDAYLQTLSHYHDIKHMATWDEISIFGIYPDPGNGADYPTFSSASLYPRYGAMKLLRDTLNYSNGDRFCSTGLSSWQDLFQIGLKKADSLDRWVIWFNRGYYTNEGARTGPSYRDRSVALAVTLDTAWPQSGYYSQKFWKFDADYNAPYYEGSESAHYAYASRTINPAPTVPDQSITVMRLKYYSQ